MAARGKSGGRIIILIALILILLLGAVYVWYQMQSGEAPTGEQPAPSEQPMVEIVITTQSIPRGAEITENTVMYIQYPEANLIQGTFITDISSVIGSRAKYDLEPGVPLTPAVLIPPTGGSAVSFDVPKDFVALPIPVDSLTSVANALAPGDHVMIVGCMLLVDIDPDFQSKLPNALAEESKTAEGELNFTQTQILTAKDLGSIQGRFVQEGTLNMPMYIVPSESQRPRLVCQTVIQDAVVLRIGDFIEPRAQPTPAPEEGEPTAITQEPGKDSVTLVVSPQDAVSLNYMMVAGIHLNLALRNPNDANAIVTDAVTQQYLMDQKNIPVPAKLPYAIEPRIDTVPTVVPANATPQP